MGKRSIVNSSKLTSLTVHTSSAGLTRTCIPQRKIIARGIIQARIGVTFINIYIAIQDI